MKEENPGENSHRRSAVLHNHEGCQHVEGLQQLEEQQLEDEETLTDNVR